MRQGCAGFEPCRRLCYLGGVFHGLSLSQTSAQFPMSDPECTLSSLPPCVQRVIASKEETARPDRRNIQPVVSPIFPRYIQRPFYLACLYTYRLVTFNMPLHPQPKRSVVASASAAPSSSGPGCRCPFLKAVLKAPFTSEEHNTGLQESVRCGNTFVMPLDVPCTR